MFDWFLGTEGSVAWFVLCLVHRGWLIGLWWSKWPATVVGVARRGCRPVDRPVRASQSGSWVGLSVSFVDWSIRVDVDWSIRVVVVWCIGVEGCPTGPSGPGSDRVLEGPSECAGRVPGAVFVGKCVRSLATGPSGARICPWAVGWPVTWGGRRLPAALSHPGPDWLVYLVFVDRSIRVVR
jgi:hypothetical protein